MTLFFVGLLLARMANSFNSRSLTDPLFTLAPFGNPALLGALGLVAAAVLAVLYVPALQLVFKTHALRPGEWLAAFLLALSVLVYGEVHKFVARPRSPGKRSEEPLPTRD
jgi:Ca2+-transporting ATPase